MGSIQRDFYESEPKPDVEKTFDEKKSEFEQRLNSLIFEFENDANVVVTKINRDVIHNAYGINESIYGMFDCETIERKK